MTDIRMVTCGKMTIYYPKDQIEALWGEQYELHSFKSGAVLVHRNGNDETVTTMEADSPALETALSEIEALLAEYPECAIEKRPYFNEIFLTDGTYRYAPSMDLTVILQNLFYALRPPMPHFAGAVTAGAALQDQQIRELQLQEPYQHEQETLKEIGSGESI